MELDCFEFGTQLLETKDLDPVYICLWESSLEERLLKKWLLAYWCFYDMGTASVICSKSNYWGMMRMAASTKHYKRGSERRHFRGENSKTSVAYLESVGVERLFEPLLRCNSCEGVMKEVTRWRGFGPWIGFKVADMLEALGLVRVHFDTESVFLFDSPQKGAEALQQRLRHGARELPKEELGSWAVKTVLGKLSKKFPLAPPRYDRPLGVQEAETVLCKWKSYLNGHYKVGTDIHHCKKSLTEKRRYPIAEELLIGGEIGGLW